MLTSVTIGYYRPAAAVEGRAQNYYLVYPGRSAPSVVSINISQRLRGKPTSVLLDSHVSHVPIDIMFYLLLLVQHPDVMSRTRSR